MQALLGPSGAGKSTLMDILAQRKSMGNLSGFLLVDGQPATSSFIRKTAYVPQVRDALGGRGAQRRGYDGDRGGAGIASLQTDGRLLAAAAGQMGQSWALPGGSVSLDSSNSRSCSGLGTVWGTT